MTPGPPHGYTPGITLPELDALADRMRQTHGCSAPLAACYVEWWSQLPFVEEFLTGDAPVAPPVTIRRGDRYTAYATASGTPLGRFVFDPGNHTPGHLWAAEHLN